MNRSANEIMGLAHKAARGAGFPPGQAELFGRASVAHLAQRGAAQDLRTALRDPADSPILRLPLLLDDILRALALGGGEIELTLQPGDEALAPAYAGLLPIRMDDCGIKGPDEMGQYRLHIVGSQKAPSRRSLPPRIEAPEDLLAEFLRLAAHTYVPASEASRKAGAGAGNIDND